jgi:hypothetical protein
MMFKHAIVVSFCLALFIVTPQQPPVETTRDIWPPGFRPAAAKPAAKPGAAPRRDRYRRATPALPADAQATDNSVLGVTIWRLRTAKESDETRILVTKGGRKTPFTPERVEADTQFVSGQMMRLSIEVPRSGYLYVIDREEYADGTLSEPYLIFPLDPARADHRVEAGRIIEIPNQSDPESYFEIKSFRGVNQPEQTGEVLTLLVSPTLLTGLPKAAKAGTSEPEPIKLMASQVSDWEKKWSVKTERLELEGGAGTAYTRAEQNAGKSREERLTAEDPPPQTVFRVAANGNQPLLVKLGLRIGKKEK